MNQAGTFVTVARSLSLKWDDGTSHSNPAAALRSPGEPVSPDISLPLRMSATANDQNGA